MNVYLDIETVYLDIETTGLSEKDEILEVAILNNSGEILLNTKIKPVLIRSWDKAQEINHISFNDVVDAPSLEEVSSNIIACVKNCNVVIYNAEFDSRFLINELKHAKSVSCCMKAFSAYYSEWSEYFNDYKWKSLKFASNYVLYQPPGDFHSALTDCFAVRAVWHFLENPTEVEYLRYKEEIEREAEYLLEFIESKKLRMIDDYRSNMSKFFFKRIFGRTENEFRVHPYFKEIKEEELYCTFTGFSKSSWEFILSFEEENKVYKLKKNVPTNLVTISYFKIRNFPRWVVRNLEVKAILLFKKKYYKLYDINEVEVEMNLSHPRFDSFKDVPQYLKSKTRLKKEGIDVDKLQLKVAADYCLLTYRGYIYVNLYNVNEAMKKMKKKKIK